MAGIKQTGTFLPVVIKWAEDAKVNSLEVVKETIQEMNNEIVETTDVDTGFLRGSFFAAINSIPQGEGAIGRGSSEINAVAVELELGQRYIMGNTAAYARRHEFGFVGVDSLGRSYNQQGRFWISRVVAKAPEIARMAIAKLGLVSE